ncbi:MAG: hypothetical protein H0U76_25845 [Ktedonobacteraceae bacterium]|nr:hypothetical protein [Ktedonobacteraceae bacterium]
MRTEKEYSIENVHDHETNAVGRIYTVRLLNKRGGMPRSLRLVWTSQMGRPMMFKQMEVTFLMMSILVEAELLAALSTITMETSFREVERLLQSLGFVYHQGDR